MKNNNVKKIAGRTKLFSAIGMFTVSAVMLASSTYAWFTMNKEVTVTGMTLHTTVSSNLLISANNVEGTYKDDLTQTQSNVLLEPVSTVSGLDNAYYYTVNAGDDGKKFDTATYSAYNPSDTSGFNSTYGLTGTDAVAVGYVDYTFFLKATTDTTGSEKLRMSHCNLLFDADGAGTDSDYAAVTEKAWRVAVFSENITPVGGLGNTGDDCKKTVEGTSYDASASVVKAGNNKTILAMPSAVNQTAKKAVNGTAADALGDVTYGTAAVLATPAANSTTYYKVTVRLWLEGEDKDCTTSTFADLINGTYKLDLQFYLDSNDGITAIETDPTFTVPVA